DCPGISAVGRAGGRGRDRRNDRLVDRSRAGNLAVGNDRVLAARLRRGRSQCDADGGRGSTQHARPARRETLKLRRPPERRGAAGRRLTIKDQVGMDPIHQFAIKEFFPILHLGRYEIAFTNSALYMLIAVLVILLLMLGATSTRALVPGRLQAVAEMSYEFIA